MRRRCAIVPATLCLLSLLPALAGAAPHPYPDESTARRYAELWERHADRVVPGLIELQLAASPADPGRVVRQGRTDLPALDASLAAMGLERLEGLFFRSLAPGRSFSDFRDRWFVAHVSPATDIRRACRALMADPGVLTAWPVLRQEILREPVAIVEPNDPSLPTQYYLATHGGVGTLRAKGAWGHSLCDSTITVAVCDTGVDLDHPDLAGPGPSYFQGNLFTDWSEVGGIPGHDDDGNGYDDDWRGWDFVDVGSGPYPGEDYDEADNDPDDFEGHGTACAGCVSAIPDNGTGIASIGWSARILPVRIAWAVEDGEGGMTAITYSTIQASAFNYAREKGAQIVSLSFTSGYTPSLAQAVTSNWNAGVIMVVSAGNDDSSVPYYLATTEQCIDVAATDQGDIKAWFSNYGSWVDVSAPGVDIRTTAVGGGLGTFDGTSFSCPITAGLVGQIYWHYYGGVAGQANAQAVTDLLTGSCDDIDVLNPSYAGLLGAGRVNAFQALGGGGFFSFPDNFTDLQEAIDFALPGDSIAMKALASGPAAGVVPDRDVAILGAWSEDYETRDPAGTRSVLTGNGVEPLLQFSDAAITPACVFDGFRLEGGGGGAGYFPDLGRYGGNMLVKGGQPTLGNLSFAGADLSDEDVSVGGGLFVAGVDLSLAGCRFESNRAVAGGGLGVYGATLTLADCTFSGNEATHATATERRGGAIHLRDADLNGNLLNFTGNRADDDGGAIYVPAGRSATLDYCGFIQNEAGNRGGALRVEGQAIVSMSGFEDNRAAAGGGAISSDGQLDVAASEFTGNGDPAAPLFGGAVSCEAGGSLDIRSSTFQGDEVAVQGAALYASGASGSFTNNTVDGVPGTLAGCAVAFTSSAVDIRNCQVTNCAGGPPVFASGSPLPTAAYNNFFGNGGEGDYFGFDTSGGDRHDDPLYADRPAGDLRLLVDSPCIDAGDPAILDFDGGHSDIGAFGGPDAFALRPAHPTNLEALVPVGGDRVYFVWLVWDANAEEDLAGYAVYRDTLPDFEATAETRIALVAPAEFPAYTDTVPDNVTLYYYKVSAHDVDGYGSGLSNEIETTGVVSDVDEQAPTEFAVRGAWPNPFNPATKLRFALPQDSRVILCVYAADGRRVLRRDLGLLPAGWHDWIWRGQGEHGRPLASGVYTVRIEAGDWRATRKLTLLK